MSEAREEVLGRIRAALAGSDRTPPPVPRGYRQRSSADLLDLFTRRVEDYQATVHACPAHRVERLLTRLLDGRQTVVPGGFPWAVPNPTPAGDLGPVELDRLDAVVTTATVGIAVTGTVVLTHGPGQGRRALSLVPDLHICVIGADQVVYGVPDAIALLDPRQPQTWISGPSATSDIELDRVEGVHGPRTLEVILTT